MERKKEIWSIFWGWEKKEKKILVSVIVSEGKKKSFI